MPSLPTLEAFYKVEESNVNQKVHAFHLEHAGLITERDIWQGSHLGREQSQKKENTLHKLAKQQSNDSLQNPIQPIRRFLGQEWKHKDKEMPSPPEELSTQQVKRDLKKNRQCIVLTTVQVAWKALWKLRLLSDRNV